MATCCPAFTREHLLPLILANVATPAFACCMAVIRPFALRRAANRKTNAMITGTVKFFNSTKGFGFIAPESGGKDVFVHISAVERAGLTGLDDNQKVTFDVESGRDGRESAANLALA